MDALNPSVMLHPSALNVDAAFMALVVFPVAPETSGEGDPPSVAPIASTVPVDWVSHRALVRATGLLEDLPARPPSLSAPMGVNAPRAYEFSMVICPVLSQAANPPMAAPVVPLTLPAA